MDTFSNQKFYVQHNYLFGFPWNISEFALSINLRENKSN